MRGKEIPILASQNRAHRRNTHLEPQRIRMIPPLLLSAVNCDRPAPLGA